MYVYMNFARGSQENESFSGTKAEKQIGDTQKTLGKVKFAQHRNLLFCFVFFKNSCVLTGTPPFSLVLDRQRDDTSRTNQQHKLSLQVGKSAHKITFLPPPPSAVQTDAALFTGYSTCCPTKALMTTKSPDTT